jgi:hypothetical protein
MEEPSGAISPTIDGEVTSYFEWIGAGTYRVDERSGSMHGKKFLVKEVQFGADGQNFFLRLDFHPGYEHELAGMEARLTAQTLNGSKTSHVTIRFAADGACARETKLAADPPSDANPVECSLARILEARIALASLAVARGGGLRFQLSLWQDGLPIDAAPQQGWITLLTTDPREMGGWTR